MQNLLKYLGEFGLSEREAMIYLYLMQHGPSTAKSITNYLKYDRLQTYRSITELENIGLVIVTMDRPRKYAPITMEEALNLLTKEFEAKLSELEKTKVKLLEEWRRTATLYGETEKAPSFRVIQGAKNFSRFAIMLYESTQKKIEISRSGRSLNRAIDTGIDDVLEECKKRGVTIRRIAEIDEKNMMAAKRFLEFSELRHVPYHKMGGFTVVDDREVVFTIVEESEALEDVVSFHTNSQTVVNMFKDLFEVEWKSALDGRIRIKELETGEHIEVFKAINDPEEVKSRLLEMIHSAKSDLIIRMNENYMSKLGVEDLMKIHSKGVKIRIMTPISKNNIEKMVPLSQGCEIRKINPCLLQVVVSDNKHFIGIFSKTEDIQTSTEYPAAFYSNSSNLISLIQNFLEESWSTAEKDLQAHRST